MKLTCPLVCFAALLAAQGALAQLRNDVLVQSPADPKEFVIPDSGWRLWPDIQASWQNDTLYLPDQVNLNQLPVNAPTGGWDTLNSSNGISVKLPAVRAGSPILVLASGDSIADRLATQLASAGAFNYYGQVGGSRAPWMGSWVFLRNHAAYDGLPTDTVMNWDIR